MGPCKDCGRQIITCWGPRCWVCTGKCIEARSDYAEKIAIAAQARALGRKLREGKPKSFRRSIGML